MDQGLTSSSPGLYAPHPPQSTERSCALGSSSLSCWPSRASDRSPPLPVIKMNKYKSCNCEEGTNPSACLDGGVGDCGESRKAALGRSHRIVCSLGRNIQEYRENTSALSCRSQECWEVAFKKMIIVSCFSVVVGNLHAGDDGQVGLEVPVHVSHHAHLDILASKSICKKN